MFRQGSWFFLVLILILPGCTAPATIDDTEQNDGVIIPERLNIVAETAHRDIDRVQTMDV